MSSPVSSFPVNLRAFTDHPHRTLTIYGFLVLFLAIYRYALFDIFDSYKCKSLLSSGSWLDEGDESTSPSNWQPEGCLFHSYSTAEATSCLESQEIIFAGDSTVRQVFWETVKLIDPNVQVLQKKHTDVNFAHNGISIRFLWDPYLNSSIVTTLDTCNNPTESRKPNSYIVVGSGLWYSRYLGDDGASLWKTNTDLIVETLKSCASYYTVPFVLPIVVPDWERLDEARTSTILRAEVSYMNNYLKWISQQRNVLIPTAFNEMMTIPSSFDESGIHSTEAVARAKANLLINMRCNQKIMAETGYPFNKTCCYRYPLPNLSQVLILAFCLIIIPGFYIKSSGMLSSPRIWRDAPTSGPVITGSLMFSTVLAYCFLSDRTSLFNKAAKQFWTSNFVIMTLLSIILGALTIRRSTTEQGFMGRDQSNEWKGWMQIMVLIYHITGASKVLPIYKYIRVMVAAYLFMTGYGHTVFFYKKGDFSLKRVANVLVRLNLLSCFLAYIMNTDYLFYYFAPLSSFWFLIVYATMRVKSSRNKDTVFVCSKIVFSAVFAHIIIATPGILESIWFILQHLFFITWDLREWRFRVLLDIYIVYIGMLGGLLSIKFSELSLRNHPMWPNVRIGVLVGSGVGLVLYQIMQARWEAKPVYNKFHPFISFIPILGFLFLRNANSTLRNTYSAAFAWVGTCSLETFTLQFHIWMAADTRGILEVVGSSHRLLNFLIMTPLFLFASNVTSEATGTLTSLIVSGIKRNSPEGSGSAAAKAVKTDVSTLKQDQDQESLLPVTEPVGLEEKTSDVTVESRDLTTDESRTVDAMAQAGVTTDGEASSGKPVIDNAANSDLEKDGVFASNGNDTTTGDVLERTNKIISELLAHPSFEATWNQMGDLRLRLLSIGMAMWVLNVITAYSK
ncbi:10 TM acyl transferase domain found in Cas1p-domain-containing protein [Lipomyces oligophaga]|uniref:10 TM acyl transferase domain found in Cas1p-domain-containing protein n=1 Tax=Lipomyces oligophaga TaxID=45792 RepID=UPI0034CF754D